MRYAPFLVSALLLSSIYVITSSTPVLAADENVVVVAADELNAASGNNRFVVWSDKTPGNYDVFVRRSTDNGATWKPVKNLSNNAGISEIPQIAVSGSNVYVTWRDTAPGNADMLFRRSTDNGATWKAVVNLSNNAGHSIKPQVYVSGSNVSWMK